MLDLDFIRNNPDAVKRAIREKALVYPAGIADGGQGIVDAIIEQDAALRELTTQLNDLRHQQNLRSKSRPSPEEIDDLKALSQQIKDLEEHERAKRHALDELLPWIPNIPSPDSPVGPDAASNVVVKTWGQPRSFSFPIKDHIALGTALDLLDFERGVEVSGFRGYYLKNEAVRMHLGLMWLALDVVKKHGFTLMMPPTIVHDAALIGSGHFPFGKNEVYRIANPGRLADGSEEKDPAYLVGTAEPSLLGYYANQTLKEADLPLALCGVSQCYRSEVGSYGKETKGLYRVHEFMKVEQVVITPADPDIAEQWFVKLLAIAEELLQALELPYRVINTSTGDMGAGKIKMMDVETWMPARSDYGETHSNSFLSDWQARRLGIRYKDASGEMRFAYTLNNTALASPRILIALFENFQEPDGSIRVPTILQPYVGTDRISGHPPST